MEKSNYKYQGLSEKGAEIALQLYSLNEKMLPPRIVASPSVDKLKMPIPFMNIAGPP